MKDIKNGTLCAIISMTSVVIMFIWGYIANDFGHSWIAVMIGGVVSCAVSMIRKDKEQASGNKEAGENKSE